MILRALAAGAFEVVTSASITAEYRAALLYDRVRRRSGMNEEQIDTVLRPFIAAQVLPAVIAPPCRDPKDDQFLAAAVCGQADYIVSVDEDLLVIVSYRGIRILSPGAFLAVMASA